MCGKRRTFVRHREARCALSAHARAGMDVGSRFWRDEGNSDAVVPGSGFWVQGSCSRSSFGSRSGSRSRFGFAPLNRTVNRTPEPNRTRNTNAERRTRNLERLRLRVLSSFLEPPPLLELVDCE